MKRKKNYFIVLVLLLLVGISIGFAVLNTTLNITGKSSISKNTWNVHFENVQITTGSVEATKIPAIENSTTVDFETQLNLPGDFYEFTVDVVNDGTIDAMIESIEKTPELSTEQQEYLNYIIEYQNGEQIASKQLVKANEFVRLKVRVELKADVSSSDLPEVGDVLNLGFTLNYVQSDGTGSSVTDNGRVLVATANGDINEIGTIVTIGSEQFYTIGTVGDNVKLLSMYNLHVGNYQDSNYNILPIENPTGMQDENMLGAKGDFATGTVEFSNTEQHGTNYTDYNGSIVEGYVNNYKNSLETKFGIEIEEARLITYDELSDSETFACKSDSEYGLKYCSEKYPWLYSTTYWSGSAVNPTGFEVWTIEVQSWGSGFISESNYWGTLTDGVRPVIVISKDYF